MYVPVAVLLNTHASIVQIHLYMHLMTYIYIVGCKNVKFAMKLSATSHAALGRCGESRRGYTP